MAGVLMGILENVTSNPLISALAGAAGVDVGEVMDKARTLAQSVTDWLPFGDLPPVQELVGMSAGGSAVGAAMPTPEKFMVGDVLFQVVDAETLEEEVDIPEHPTEDRQMVADHTWRQPTRLSVKGSLIGFPTYTERHKQALVRLQKIKQDGLPVTVICDFPPGRLPDMVLRRFSVSREHPWKNEYKVDIELQKAEYVGKATTSAGLPDVAAPDPAVPRGVAAEPEGAPRAEGMKESKTGSAPPKEVFGGILDAVRGGIEKLSDSKLGKMALDWGKNMLRNTIPGAGLVMDALSGNLSARSLLEAGASFIPGGAALLDAALSAVDAGVAALEAVGGLDALAGVISGETSLEELGRNAVATLITAASSSNPALGAIGTLARGALGV